MRGEEVLQLSGHHFVVKVAVLLDGGAGQLLELVGDLVGPLLVGEGAVEFLFQQLVKASIIGRRAGLLVVNAVVLSLGILDLLGDYFSDVPDHLVPEGLALIVDPASEEAVELQDLVRFLVDLSLERLFLLG